MKKTDCVPGSERPVRQGGRMRMICTCAECGFTKTIFEKNKSGVGGDSVGPLGAVVKGINIGKEFLKSLYQYLLRIVF